MSAGRGWARAHVSLSSPTARDPASVTFGSSLARHEAAARGGYASRPGPKWAGVDDVVGVNPGGCGTQSGSQRAIPVFLRRNG